MEIWDRNWWLEFRGWDGPERELYFEGGWDGGDEGELYLDF